ASGIVVDTHVTRISQRLELTRNEAAEKIEADLQKLIPPKDWISFSHRVIAHGRQTCIARKPRCAACILEPVCFFKDKTV
ncbi:MAG: endonuclease III domain-containing protein, partial [Terriglobales bacterium]